MQVRPSPSPPVWRWLVLAPALFCLSCSGGPKLNQVKGQVLYKNNPIRGAVVTFHLKGSDPLKAIPSSGMTQEDGTFTLTTGQKEGAPAGEYVVTVIWPKENTPKEGKILNGPPPDVPNQLPAAYADRDKSKLTAEIKNGENQLQPFSLK